MCEDMGRAEGNGEEREGKTGAKQALAAEFLSSWESFLQRNGFLTSMSVQRCTLCSRLQCCTVSAW